MNQTLKNKCALVTGGSRGIGAAIVKRLASEGANVALTYSNSPDPANEVVKAAQASGVRSLAIQADSADASAVVTAVERTVSELGGIDILVNNAGILVTGPLEDFKLADFDRTLAINVRAVFVATQAAVNTEMNPEDGEFAVMLKKVNALPRYGTAEEIAGMVAYLAGPEAAYITGASLMIDGGFKKVSRSALMVSASVVGMPCGKPL